MLRIDFTIKTKLYLTTAVLVISLATFGILYNLSNAELSRLQGASDQIFQAQASVLMLRRHEKDFLSRLEAKYLTRFEDTASNLSKSLKQTRSTLQRSDIASEALIGDMETKLQAYQRDFMTLADYRKRIGFDHESGLHGTAREAAHFVERRIENIQDDKLHVMLLTLRRNEKDFLQRSDSNYINQFEQNYQLMLQQLPVTQSAEDLSTAIQSELDQYRAAFVKLADLKETIGLTPEQGLQGELRKSVHQVEEMSGALSDQVVKAIIKKKGEINRNLILFGCVIAALLSALLILLSRSITHRLQQVNNLMNNISRGNADLSVRMDTEGNDELSALASSFNIFVGKLQQLVQRVTVISGQLSESASETAHLTQTSSDNAKRQQQESESVASAVNEITATSRDIAGNVNNAAHEAENVHTRTVSGKQINLETSENIEQLASSVSDAQAVISKLRQDSEQISMVIGVIRDITEQTNLLALNAAIEAARAGEQGRGFAVVADQVRELATKTHSSTDEITRMIGNIQAGVKHSVSAMEISKERADESVVKMQTTVAAMEEVVSSVTLIFDQNTQIASAADQQTSATEDIDRNVTRISSLAADTTEATEQATEKARQMADLSVELNTLVAGFKA